MAPQVRLEVAPLRVGLVAARVWTDEDSLLASKERFGHKLLLPVLLLALILFKGDVDLLLELSLRLVLWLLLQLHVRHCGGQLLLKRLVRLIWKVLYQVWRRTLSVLLGQEMLVDVVVVVE